MKNIGFAMSYRWQGEFAWQSSIVAPTVSSQQLSVMPAFGTFDAQMSIKMKALKSILKIGGSNLFNKTGVFAGLKVVLLLIGLYIENCSLNLERGMREQP